LKFGIICRIYLAGRRYPTVKNFGAVQDHAVRGTSQSTARAAPIAVLNGSRSPSRLPFAPFEQTIRCLLRTTGQSANVGEGAQARKSLPGQSLNCGQWLKTLDPEDRRIIGEGFRDVEFSWPIGMPSHARGTGRRASVADAASLIIIRATLFLNFFPEVRRVLSERGVSSQAPCFVALRVRGWRLLTKMKPRPLRPRRGPRGRDAGGQPRHH
jgi:hypothetical protein